MADPENSPFPDVLGAVARAWLGGVTIPKEFKTKKAVNMDIPPKGVLDILRSTGRAGFACSIAADGGGVPAYATFHLLRVWIGTDWNSSSPIVEGAQVLAALTGVVHEIRARELAEEAAAEEKSQIEEARA